MIWSSSWSWQQDLLLRESVCVSALLLTRPDAKACSHMCACVWFAAVCGREAAAGSLASVRLVPFLVLHRVRAGI